MSVDLWMKMEGQYEKFIDHWKTIGQNIWDLHDARHLMQSISHRGEAFRALLTNLDATVEAFDYFVKQAKLNHVTHEYTCSDCAAVARDEGETRMYDKAGVVELRRLTISLKEENDKLRARLTEGMSPPRGTKAT